MNVNLDQDEVYVLLRVLRDHADDARALATTNSVDQGTADYLCALHEKIRSQLSEHIKQLDSNGQMFKRIFDTIQQSC